MASRRSRSGPGATEGAAIPDLRRRERALMRRFKRDLDWPRHMKAKRLKTGVKAYYWQPHGRDISAGFTLHSEHWERTLRSLVTAPSSSTRISMPGERAKARQRASM